MGRAQERWKSVGRLVETSFRGDLWEKVTSKGERKGPVWFGYGSTNKMTEGWSGGGNIWNANIFIGSDQNGQKKLIVNMSEEQISLNSLETHF